MYNMIRLTKTKLLALLCLAGAMIFVACKKDSEKAASGQVELLSFGPTGANVGDTLRFIGLNLDKVTEIQLTGASVKQSEFKSQSPTLILITVPATTEKGYVTLKTTQGDIVTKTQLNIGITTTIATMTGQARPGQDITITGDFLNWVDRITFANGKLVTAFKRKKKNQLVVTVPDDAQTGPLVIHYSGTDSLDIITQDTLKVTLPMATGLAPNPIKHADNLTITGTDLDLTTQVKFTGVATAVTSFVSKTASELVVKVPGATQKGKITLVAASGVTTTSATDLDIIMPGITSMAPNPIDTGANLTITGTNLDLVASVAFVGPATPSTTFVSQSATQIVVKVPSGTLKGKITLGVKNSTLTVQSSTDLLINGGLPALPDFPFAIYTDANQNTFQDWSYTDTHDFNSTANVRQGTKSIRAVYGGNTYQGLTFHAGTAASTTGYTKLEFSVFGEAGTAGKKINIVTNGAYGTPFQITIVGGEWTTYSIPLTSLGSPATIGEIVLQSAGWTGTIHVDHVGLR